MPLETQRSPHNHVGQGAVACEDASAVQGGLASPRRPVGHFRAMRVPKASVIAPQGVWSALCQPCSFSLAFKTKGG